MKKLVLNLTGLGVAMAFGLMAQSAEAGSAQCPDNGNGDGGEQQIELGDSGCVPAPSYAPISVTAYTADNVALDVSTTIENADELLQPGDVIEVEIDLDDVMAHLKANEQDALLLAAATGVRPGSSFKAGHVTSAKLSDAEVEAVAKYMLVNLQSGRATGRSDPAGSNTSRAAATAQAVGRAIGSAVRSAFSLRVSFTRVTERQPNGAVRYQTELQVTINEPD